MRLMQLDVEDCWQLKPLTVDSYAVVGLSKDLRIIGVFEILNTELARVLFPAGERD